MHSRVKELLGECISNQMITTHEVDLDKFARLIIDECIYVIAHTSDRYRRDYFAQKLRDYFNELQ